MSDTAHAAAPAPADNAANAPAASETTASAAPAPADNANGATFGAENGSAASEATTIGEQAGFDWAINVNADNLETVQAKGWKSVDDVLQSYGELNAKLGERPPELPDPETATEEDWAAWNSYVGVPEAAENYQFTMPEGLPEDAPYDALFADEFRQMAIKAGLSTKQANDLHGDYVTRQTGLFEAQGEANTQRIATAHTELQSKIGEEGSSEYNRSMEMANRAMKQLGLEPSLKANGTIVDGMVADATMVAALARVGEGMFSEDTVYSGSQSIANNPFSTANGATENMTQVMAITQSDPARARQMCEAAGKNPADYGL